MRFAVAHDGDVAFPEYQIAAPQIGEIGDAATAPRACSCMSLSRGQDTPQAASAT